MVQGAARREGPAKGGRTLEKCFLPLSSSVGGGFCSVMSSTFMGGNLANGACPCAISSSVMPKDQMSAELSYPDVCSITSGAILHRAQTGTGSQASLSTEHPPRAAPRVPPQPHDVLLAPSPSGPVPLPGASPRPAAPPHQQGVPTNVMRCALLCPHEPVRSMLAATPKSPSCT